MTKEDKVQVSVQINGKQGINELGKLEMQANEVKFAMKGLKKGSDEYVAATQKYNGIKTRIKGVREELGLQGMTLQQLRRYQRDLTREMDTGVTRGTKRYAQLNKQIIAVNHQISRQRAEMRGATGLWNSLGKQVKQFGALALGYLGITAITSQISNLIGRAGDLSDALATVSKTTGLTADEVEDLNKQLKKLDTRTARKELLEMAKIAGKLGLTSKNDILGFVSAADKINVALGEDLGAPEESMRKLGKLVETFKVKEVYGIEQALLKVGSSINHLGKSSTANEGFIVEFTKRMGGIAPLAKITIQDILGLAAASDALGLTQEVTTTALSKLFIKMTSNREVFAQYAKDIDGNQLSLEQFSHLIDTNFNEAFLSLLRGVNDNSEGMIALSETLSDLELDGGRVVQVLGTLSNNTKLIGEQQKISNDEFEKGTSVLNEFNLMNETLGAKLDKVGKAMYAWFVNTTFVRAIEGIVGWMEKLVRVPVSERMEDQRRSLNRLKLELNTTNISQQRRLEIIEELQKTYPSFLENIDKEKVSNQELNKAIEKINESLINKIVIQKKEEEIQDKIEKAGEVKTRALRLESELQDEINQILESRNLDTPTGGNTLEQAQSLLQKLDELDGKAKNIRTAGGLISVASNQEFRDLVMEYNSLLSTTDHYNDLANDLAQEKSDLMKKLFPDSSDYDPKKNKKVVGPVISTGGTTKPSQNQGESLIDEFEDEYRRHTLALKEARGEDLLTEEQYKADLLALEMTHLTAMIELKKLLGQDTISEEEALADAKIEAIRRVEKVEQDALSNSKEANKERVISIEEGIQALGSSMSNLFGSLASLSDQSTEQGIENALRLSNMQVIAAQTAALASAIQGATAAAAATGPGAPFVLAGYIASMLATVVGAFAQIKQNQKSAKESQQGLRDKKDTSGRGRYNGGDSPSTGIGFGDEDGEYTGFTHKNEFVVSEDRMKRGAQVVIPSYSSSPSKVVDLSALNSTAASGARFSDPSSSGNNAQMEQMVQRMEAAAEVQRQSSEKMAQYYSVLLKDGIQSKFSRTTFKDATDDLQERNTNRSKGSLR